MWCDDVKYNSVNISLIISFCNKCTVTVYKCIFGEWQACRGDKHDDPVTPMDMVDSKQVNEVVVDAGVVQTLPAGADFIMCYSVAEGEC